MKLEGVYSVLPTPFTAAGDLDLESLKRVIDLFIGAGVNGLTALGVTSEIGRMNDSERARVLETFTRTFNIYYSCWMRKLDAIRASADPRFPRSPCHSQIGDLSDSDKSLSAIPLFCSAWGWHFVRL